MSAGPQIQTIWPFVFSPKQLLYLCFSRCLKKSKIYKITFFQDGMSQRAAKAKVSQSREVSKRQEAPNVKEPQSAKGPRGTKASRAPSAKAPKRQRAAKRQSAKGPRGTKASRAPSAKAPKRQAPKRSGFEALRRRTRAKAPKHPSVQALRL